MDGIPTVPPAAPFVKHGAEPLYFCGPAKHVVDGKKLDHAAMLTATTLYIGKADGAPVAALDVELMDKVGTNADAGSQKALKDEKSSLFIIIQMKGAADDVIFSGDACGPLAEGLGKALAAKSITMTTGAFKKPSDCTVKMRMPKTLVEDPKAASRFDALVGSSPTKDKKDKEPTSPTSPTKADKKEKKDKSDRKTPLPDEKKDRKTPVGDEPPVDKKKDKADKADKKDKSDKKAKDDTAEKVDDLAMSARSPPGDDDTPLHFPIPRVDNVTYNKATGLLDLAFPYTQPAPATIRKEYAKADPTVVSMMPSLNFGAYYWAGHVAYHPHPSEGTKSNIELKVGILTSEHLYVGANFHYDRCIAISSIQTIFLRARLRNHSSHVRILAVFKIKGASSDCCFEFAHEQEAVKVISILMRLAIDINRNHDILTAPFESLDDPQFQFANGDDSPTDKVHPLPLVDDFQPVFGRYRQRLIDIYSTKAPEKMEDVDRVLYMFPHEEDSMVLKLQEQFGMIEDDCDESDILGAMSRRQTKHQTSFMHQHTPFTASGVPSFLQQNSPIRDVAHMSSSRRAGGDESLSVYDPSPIRTASSPVGQYDVGSPSGTRPTISTTNQSVGDILTQRKFSWRMFNTAARNSRHFDDVTTETVDPDSVARVRRLASLVGEDEERFLSMVGDGGGGSVTSPVQQQQHNQSSRGGTWEPTLEPLQHSMNRSHTSHHGSLNASVRSPLLPTRAQPPSQIRAEHKLWPYL